MPTLSWGPWEQLTCWFKTQQTQKCIRFRYLAKTQSELQVLQRKDSNQVLRLNCVACRHSDIHPLFTCYQTGVMCECWWTPCVAELIETEEEEGSKGSEIHPYIPFISQLNGLKDLGQGIISDVIARRKSAKCCGWDRKQNAINKWTKGYLAVLRTSLEDQWQGHTLWEEAALDDVIYETVRSVFLVHMDKL